MERQTLGATAGAFATKQEAVPAIDAARKYLRATQRTAGGQEAEAAAWKALAGALAFRDEDASEMLEAAKTARGIYRRNNLRVGEASTLADVARANLQLHLAQDGLASAGESLAVWRELGQSKGMVSALELII